MYLAITGRWSFIYGDPWLYRSSDGAYSQMSSGEIDGWMVLSYPWTYFYGADGYFFIFGPTWIQDMTEDQLFQFGG